jgi:hypothetical protein
MVRNLLSLIDKHLSCPQKLLGIENIACARLVRQQPGQTFSASSASPNAQALNPSNCSS